MFHLLNVHDQLMVHFPLALVKGELNPFCGCMSVEISVVCPPTVSRDFTWSIHHACFKAFVPLEHGTNYVNLRCTHYSAVTRLVYHPLSENALCIRPIYVICEDELGEFQAPVGSACDWQSACRRISFGIRLLQTLTAECFYMETGKRFTFLCAANGNSAASCDPAQYAPCTLHYSKLKCADVYGASAETVWARLARELHADYHDVFAQTKWVAFLACTRYTGSADVDQANMVYEDIQKLTKAHFALGK